jgi:hypothetical protein
MTLHPFFFPFLMRLEGELWTRWILVLTPPRHLFPRRAYLEMAREKIWIGALLGCAEVAMVIQLTILCPRCQKLFPAKILNTQRTMDGERIRSIQAECDEHGMLDDLRSDLAFEMNAVLRLSARRTVACPHCGCECPANVLNETDTFDGSRFRILEGECPSCGRFLGSQSTPSASAAR